MQDKLFLCKPLPLPPIFRNTICARKVLQDHILQAFPKTVNLPPGKHESVLTIGQILGINALLSNSTRQKASTVNVNMTTDNRCTHTLTVYIAKGLLSTEMI